jgi:hypothetical protein
MGKYFDHFLKYTPLTSYETFMDEVSKGDELRNRYFYDSIKWGEKYRHDKNNRQLKYLKNRRDKEAKAKEQARLERDILVKALKEATIQPIPPVSTEAKGITLYQGDPKRRGSTLSIGENTFLPKTNSSVVPINPIKHAAVLNIIKNTYQ